MTATDPLDYVTHRVFDALNRLSTSKDPNSGIVAYTYDAHDRPLSVTDPLLAVTSYVYDGFGDRIQQVSPATGTTVYRYDSDGNVTQKTDATGTVANYTYDGLDRITAAIYPADPPENVTYNYDQSGHGFGVGQLTSVADAMGTLSRSYDERGNLLSESRSQLAVTLPTAYAYDAASRIASITYPSGLTVEYTRDAAGRITGMSAQPKGSRSSDGSALQYRVSGFRSAEFPHLRQRDSGNPRLRS